MAQFLSSVKCKIQIFEDELICALKNMPKNKSVGNDGLTKEFHETYYFIATLRKSILKVELTNAQEQAVIILIEKKDKNKRFIQN